MQAIKNAAPLGKVRIKRCSHKKKRENRYITDFVKLASLHFLFPQPPTDAPHAMGLFSADGADARAPRPILHLEKCGEEIPRLRKTASSASESSSRFSFWRRIRPCWR
ncbi:hypothetical protein NPIL_555301 [Nephila pilipes]|uniref:Uncharacterized protein n=1 Tax=Nephila pilipes TaxID=299642 RepID=A0A8X6TTH0_NEPPI|nr:hypothetical protein NPIL_555301 [Nephila pilipes]